MEAGRVGSLDILNDASIQSIQAGDLKAVFVPWRGMVCVSLQHKGIEILRRIDNLDALAKRGSAAGMPLLHPWANRLSDFSYAVLGKKVKLDPESPLLHHDEHGLPIHGVPWSRLKWRALKAQPDSLAAQLDWDSSELWAVFPFPHRLEMMATIHPSGLTVETTLIASQDAPVPVSFGFHPYFGIPGLKRSAWRIKLPAMRRLLRNQYGIPTGAEEPFGQVDGQLGKLDYDDGFSLLKGPHVFSLAGAGRRITIEFLEGFSYAQVFAPKAKDYVAIEPMTAPTNALVTGQRLQVVAPGGQFRTAFRICVDSTP